MRVVAGLFHRIAWGVVIGLVVSFAAFTPTYSPSQRRLASTLAYLDLPVSAIERVIPWADRGVRLFFMPPGYCHGVAPDMLRVVTSQVVLSVLVYTAIFYFPNVVGLAVRRRRSRHAG